MAKFYFTYGSDERFPFQYGWTEIEAPNVETACDIFQAVHPNRPGSSCLNCADYYSEAAFEKTEMARSGNGHRFCHERITFTHEIFTDTEKE